jgi:hypothetical protein
MVADRLRRAWRELCIVALLMVIGPTALSAVALQIHPVNPAFGAILSFVADVWRDPFGAQQQMKDIDTLAKSWDIGTDGQTLSTDWCNDYIVRSDFWIRSDVVLSPGLRRARVICYDVVGLRADALTEADTYLAHPNSDIVDVGFTGERGRAGLGLLIDAVAYRRYELADVILRRVQDYSLNGASIGDRFGRGWLKKLTPMQLSDERRICRGYVKNARFDQGSVFLYRCVRLGLAPRSILPN